MSVTSPQEIPGEAAAGEIKSDPVVVEIQGEAVGEIPADAAVGVLNADDEN